MENRPKVVFLFSGAVVFLILFYLFLLSAPADFPTGKMVEVESGMSLRSISALLKKEHLIRSRAAFESFVIIFRGDKNIMSADYVFEEKLPVFSAAWRIGTGAKRLAPVSVTIPEGFDINQIADTFALNLKNFSKANFLLKTKELEGYLFPDTYFFLTKDSEEDVIKAMSDNFSKKIASLLPDIAASGKTEKAIIIMASIIEREAKGDADREIISGILWKRISLGTPLQVDAAPDTYKNKGLPKNPIGNPGLLAIKAAIHPTSSVYLYYLHDKNGNIHYAKTFAEHKLNRQKYLQ